VQVLVEGSVDAKGLEEVRERMGCVEGRGKKEWRQYYMRLD
jgi:hypothetical protein